MMNIDSEARLNTDTKQPVIIGMLLLIIGFGSFLLWAFLAPLDQGVPGSGILRISGERKEVQSLSGGSIDAINIREGDVVKEGQVLISLNQIQSKAQHSIIKAQWGIAKAMQTRLIAEQNNQGKIIWPEELIREADDIRIRGAMELQDQQFKTRRSEYDSMIGILNRNLDGLKDQLKGYLSIQNSHSQQIKSHHGQLAGLTALAKDGYVAKNRLLEAERESSQLSAQLAQDISNIGKTQQLIAEAQLKILLQQQTFRKDVEEQLASITKETSTLSDKLTAAKFDIEHTEIKAPVAGQIVGLRVHTEGGVLSSGQHLMDVVPSGSPLVIEAKFLANALDKLKPGLEVNIQFPTLNRVDTPKTTGFIRTVSADQLIDEGTKQPYFIAEVVLPPANMKKITDHGIQFRPGLPVDVVVVTGERTMMNYLMKPFSRIVLGAFKEN